MAEKERELWERNIAPENKRLWLTTIRWKLRLFNRKVRKMKTPDDFSFDLSFHWSTPIGKLMLIMVVLMCLQLVIQIVKETVYLVYPNYGNNTQIIRDFIESIGAS